MAAIEYDCGARSGRRRGRGKHIIARAGGGGPRPSARSTIKQRALSARRTQTRRHEPTRPNDRTLAVPCARSHGWRLVVPLQHKNNGAYHYTGI